MDVDIHRWVQFMKDGLVFDEQRVEYVAKEEFKASVKKYGIAWIGFLRELYMAEVSASHQIPIPDEADFAKRMKVTEALVKRFLRPDGHRITADGRVVTASEVVLKTTSGSAGTGIRVEDDDSVTPGASQAEVIL